MARVRPLEEGDAVAVAEPATPPEAPPRKQAGAKKGKKARKKKKGSARR